MAGWDPQAILGGDQPTLTQASSSGSGMGPGSLRGLAAGAVQPHHGLIGIVLLAVLAVFVLDRLGFRFAVTVGRG